MENETLGIKNGKHTQDERAIAAHEVCEKLCITPHVLRNICDEFSDLIPLTRRDGKTYLEPIAFSRLQIIFLWRAKGLNSDEIRDRLLKGFGHGLDSQPKQTLPLVADKANLFSKESKETVELKQAVEIEYDQDGIKQIMDELRSIKDRISLLEKKRSEEKDRLSMALTRVQQEVQQLKFEMNAVTSTPRSKRKKGFFGRLFG